MFQWARDFYGLSKTGDPVDQFMFGWSMLLLGGFLLCAGALIIGAII